MLVGYSCSINGNTTTEQGLGFIAFFVGGVVIIAIITIAGIAVYRWGQKNGLWH
jgi:multisubunit Na+/H+ antiporter MnhB subunit